MKIICPFCKKVFELSKDKRKHPAYMSMSLTELDKYIKLMEKAKANQKK